MLGAAATPLNPAAQGSNPKHTIHAFSWSIFFGGGGYVIDPRFVKQLLIKFWKWTENWK